ncbi:hypothetical protein GCM10027614_06180 [Micromonospora vulcania]
MVMVSARIRHSATMVCFEARFAGRIQSATLQSMNGSRNTRDSVRTAVPDGRSLQRYASSVTPPAPVAPG